MSSIGVPAPHGTSCLVCGESISKHRSVNYGGLSCNGCRTFFRRIVLKTSPQDLVCRSSGSSSSEPCIIDTETRNICRKCRYDKCIAAGMEPHLVHERGARAVGSSVTSKLSELEKSKEEGQDESDSTPFAFTKSSCLILGSVMGKGFVTHLIKFHVRLSLSAHFACPCQLENIRLDLMRGLHAQTYQSFGNTIPSLAELGPVERANMLHLAKKLHFTYIMARYFTARTGWDQINWLVGESELVANLSDDVQKKIGIVALHSLLQHCKDETKRSLILKVCVALANLNGQRRSIRDILDNKAQMARAILCYISEDILVDSNPIKANIKASVGIGNREITKHIVDLVSTLVEPFESILASLGHCSVKQSQPRLVPTRELSLWLGRSRSRFDQIWLSPCVGPEGMTNWMTILSKGTNPETSFSGGFKVLLERIKRVLLSHEKFPIMECKAQGLFFMQCAMKLTVISVLPLRMFRCWMDQLKIFAGREDIELVNAMLEQQEFSRFKTHPEEFSAILLATVLENCGLAHPDLTAEFRERQDRVAGFFADEASFQLMTLVACFTPALSMAAADPLLNYPAGLLALRNRYLRALEQRTHHQAEEILRAVHDIEKLVNIMMITVGRS